MNNAKGVETSIQVILTDEEEGADYRQFMISISLPDKYAVMPLSFPHASMKAERGASDSLFSLSGNEIDA